MLREVSTVSPLLSRFRAALVALALALTPACSSNLFTDYPEVAGPGQAAFSQGRFEAAAKQFRSIREADEDDAFLPMPKRAWLCTSAATPLRQSSSG